LPPPPQAWRGVRTKVSPGFDEARHFESGLSQVVNSGLMSDISYTREPRMHEELVYGFGAVDELAQ
jgi:hypothetical protein